MEKSYFEHPLDCVCYDENLFLLESLIPYVDYSMKLPLAFMVKFMELKKIMHTFSRRSSICACGMHQEAGDIKDVLLQICKQTNHKGFSQINQMFDMMNSMEMAKSMMSMMEAMKQSETENQEEKTEEEIHSKTQQTDNPRGQQEELNESIEQKKNETVDMFSSFLPMLMNQAPENTKSSELYDSLMDILNQADKEEHQNESGMEESSGT